MIPNKIFYQYIFFFPLLVEMLSGKVGDSTNARFYDTIKKLHWSNETRFKDNMEKSDTEHMTHSDSV